MTLFSRYASLVLASLCCWFGTAQAKVETLTDVLGREVQVDLPAKRVVLAFYFEDYMAVGGEQAFDRVVGISKLARVVRGFARRLQIQENLTREIADAIESVTQAAGVAVVIEAQHMCMMMRGVEKQNSSMNTSVMLGAFRESCNTRMEFLQLIGRSN